jgi:hypothetical protein
MVLILLFRYLESTFIDSLQLGSHRRAKQKWTELQETIRKMREAKQQ